MKSAFNYFMPFQLYVVAVIFCGVIASAYETDQYTTPLTPLADIGEDLSQFIYDETDKAIQRVNKDLQELPSQIKKIENEINQLKSVSPGADPENDETARDIFKYLKRQLKKAEEYYKSIQTEAGIVSAIHSQYGGKITWQEQRDGVMGLPLGFFQYPKNLKNGNQITFRAGKLDIVYSYAGFHRIVSPTYFVFASTLKAYNVYFGVDKVGHFFNQGFQYYELYEKEKSLKKVVDWGVSTEDGIFGKIVDGVYSNADLAANFAGFFYHLNLFKEIKLGSKTYPARLVRLNDGQVQWNQKSKTIPSGYLKNYISKHFDEALNPSVLEAPQRGIVRKAIKNRCATWAAYNGFQNRAEVEAIRTNLNTWYGFDYGYRAENALKVEQICWPN